MHDIVPTIAAWRGPPDVGCRIRPLGQVVNETSDPTVIHASHEVSAMERAAVVRALEIMGNPPIELELWNGEVIGGRQGEPVARMRIRQRSILLRLLYRPDLYFGEGYSEGDIEVEGDLVRLLECVDPLDHRGMRRRLWERLKLKFPLLAPHTLEVARRNVHHHYDLSNAFYRLWLDPELVYTCAYFPTPDTDLATAQLAKMEYVCRKLRLQRGETVVEAGCGWGALARYMARDYGVHVKAYNISHEQIVYARERARSEGLEGQIEFIEDDYRAIEGRCDAFVSVGMLEHVGKARYEDLGEVIDRVLGPDGRGLLHSIGRDRPMPMNAWITRHIFPGAYPPSLSEMLEVLEPGGFSVLDVENLRLHYVRTLELWLQRYEGVLDTVREQFDEFFVRTWRFYLAGSIAGFRTGSLQLFQVSFARAGMNDLPWTRASLYREPLAGDLPR